jgi:hypothetical protein
VVVWAVATEARTRRLARFTAAMGLYICLLSLILPSTTSNFETPENYFLLATLLLPTGLLAGRSHSMERNKYLLLISTSVLGVTGFVASFLVIRAFEPGVSMHIFGGVFGGFFGSLLGYAIGGMMVALKSGGLSELVWGPRHDSRDRMS